MKFYFVRNSNQKEVILSTRVTAGTLPDQIQEEIDVPDDFFITLPVGVLTKPLDNAYNEDLRLRRIRAFDSGLVSVHISKHGNRIPTNPVLFQTAFSNMYGLERLQKDQTDDFKIDPNLDEYKPEPGVVEPVIPGLDEGWERVTVQRWLPDGVNFETIAEAAIERKHEDEVYVAYGTSALKPAILYVASSLEQVKEMFAKTQHPNSLLCGYTNWTWYVTSRISKTLQAVFDTLETENLSSSLKFHSVDEKPLVKVTYGEPIIDEVFKFFRENVDKDTERSIPQIIGSYTDTKRAGVCDIILTNTEPTYKNLNSFEMNTDSAYIRTGFCSIAYMKESPADKLISDKSIEVLVENEINEGAAPRRRALTRDISARIIPNIPPSDNHLYILSTHELHFVANRAKRVGVDENILVTKDHSQISRLWDYFENSPATIKSHTSTLLLDGISGILEITGHDCKINPKLFYVNRTQEEIYRLNVTPKMFSEFQEVHLGLAIPGSRILFLDELRWLGKRGFHTNAHLISEAEIKAQEEEKKSAEAAAQPRSTQDIQKALDTAVKKLQTNVTLNKYDRFAALLKEVKEAERPLVVASVGKNLKDSVHIKRLNMFYKQFQSPVTAQVPASVGGLTKK